MGAYKEVLEMGWERKVDRKLANRVCRGDFRTGVQHRMHQEANCSHRDSVCSVHSCVPGTCNSNPPLLLRLQAGTTRTIHLMYTEYLINACRVWD